MTGQQLKNSILQEAIQGRLVPNVLQPGEKTGAELLQDILAERQKKENEEKGKKAKKLALSTIEEEPWELPEGWCWARLGEVMTFVNGRAYKKEELLSAGKYKVLRVGNFFTNDSWYYSDLELPEEKYCFRGDLLYAWSASFGPWIWEGEKTIFHYHIWNVKFNESLLFKKYLYWFFEADKHIIRESTTGSTMVHVSMENMMPRMIPIPPLSIQKAIVEKIESLFPLVDEYDKAAGELKALNESLPDKLRKSVLLEAIHGNLVTNDIPEGEATASELLQQILKERQDKENKEKGKKAKKLTLSKIEEEPWELPEGWCWCRGKDIFLPMESIKPSSDFIYIDTDAVNNKRNIIDNPKHIRLADSPSRATRKLHENDILFSMVRPYLKNIAYVDDVYSTAIGTTGFYVITTSSLIYQPYIFKMMLSDYVVSGLTEYMKGDNSPSINNGHIEDFIYPLPPLSIQKAIVAKIEEVFAAIDILKA